MNEKRNRERRERERAENILLVEGRELVIAVLVVVVVEVEVLLMGELLVGPCVGRKCLHFDGPCREISAMDVDFDRN